MGAGIVECDVTFTSDGELVCRHSECDLHTTTDIVATPPQREVQRALDGPELQPALLHQRPHAGRVQDADGPRWTPACPAPTTPQGFLGGTASWRTDLYTGRGTLMTLRESIALNERNGVKHTPELKGGDPARIAQVFGSQAAVRAEAGRRAAGRPTSIRATCGCSRSTRTDVLYWVQQRAGLRTAGGLPRQRRSHRQPARPAADQRAAARAAAAGRALLRAAHAGAARRRRAGPGGAVAVRPRHQAAPASRSSPGRSSAPTCAGARREAGFYYSSTPRAAPSRRTATCTRRSTCWPGT